MGVNKQDIQREQLAHAETKRALEAALRELSNRPKPVGGGDDVIAEMRREIRRLRHELSQLVNK